MSEPYTGSYQEDTRVLFFDKSVEPTLIERGLDYDKEKDVVSITVPDNGELHQDVLEGLCIPDLEDNYLYSHYNVDANVPENMQEV